MKKTIVALLGGTCLLLGVATLARSAACPDKIPQPIVRTLNLATKGGAGLLVVTTEAEARAAWGEDAARQCAALVDFTKEKIVRISFETVGPPDAFLSYKVDGNHVKFLIENPPIGIRGRRQGTIVQVFAVPIGTKVSLNYSCDRYRFVAPPPLLPARCVNPEMHFQQEVWNALICQWVSDEEAPRPLEFLKDGTVRIGFLKVKGKWQFATGPWTVTKNRVEFTTHFNDDTLRYYLPVTFPGTLKDSALVGTYAKRPIKWIRVKPIILPESDTDLPGRERDELHRLIEETRRLLVIKLLHEWQGKFPAAKDEPLMKAAPKSGFITKEKDWAILCQAWNLGKHLPKIDFTKQLVLVDVAPGSVNSFQMTSVTLHGLTGDLRTFASFTEIAGPGFIYRIRVVERTGVKMVNGHIIDKA